jgi:5-formyltetrahydrofolate cyclo-ligase
MTVSDDADALSTAEARAQQQAEIDGAAIDGAKQMLRKAILFRRDARAADQRQRDDVRRMAIMRSALTARMPDTVAAYLSTGSEPGTLQLVAWLAARGVRVLLPVLSHPIGGGRLDAPAWAPYKGPDGLRTGLLSILEPTGDPLPAEQLPEAELIICPGLAANLQGDRLGRGGGWYDRALRFASQSAPVWLLLNADEILATIPTRSWDQRVDMLITPEESISCEPSVRDRS